MIKCIAISDMHGILPQITEEFEILFICGDILPLIIQSNIPKSERWLKKQFSNWINSLNCKKVFAVWGNHDYIGESCYYDKSRYSNILYKTTDNKIKFLDDESVEYLGSDGNKYLFWGSPWCTIFGKWAFMAPEGFLRIKYDSMPNNCDLILTHDAPDIGEMGVIQQGYYSGERAGNAILYNAILEHKPKMAISGHIHSSMHYLQKYPECETTFATVSIVDETYNEAYEPLQFELDK
jgi:Icc-related predicted phosphoesterase